MDMNTLWFILITILYMGYFVLEGFDFGVGILLPFLGKGDDRRRVLLNTIGPHWDGNEVWLITAGGATFAAFPHWYAPCSAVLLPFSAAAGVIVRGGGWNSAANWKARAGGPPGMGDLHRQFLCGAPVGSAFTNFIQGVPIDASMNYVGGFGTC